MKFEEILPALRAGKKVRRSSWGDGLYITFPGETPHGGVLLWKDDNKCNDYYSPSRDDFNANDWEVVKETKKVKLRDLTEEQYEKWFNDNCCSKNENKSITDCFKCVIHNAICNPVVSRCWTKHKDLYSDKFLDREVEIEE